MSSIGGNYSRASSIGTRQRASSIGRMGQATLQGHSGHSGNIQNTASSRTEEQRLAQRALTEKVIETLERLRNSLASGRSIDVSNTVSQLKRAMRLLGKISLLSVRPVIFMLRGIYTHLTSTIGQRGFIKGSLLFAFEIGTVLSVVYAMKESFEAQNVRKFSSDSVSDVQVAPSNTTKTSILASLRRPGRM